MHMAKASLSLQESTATAVTYDFLFQVLLNDLQLHNDLFETRPLLRILVPAILQKPVIETCLLTTAWHMLSIWSIVRFMNWLTLWLIQGRQWKVDMAFDLRMHVCQPIFRVLLPYPMALLGTSVNNALGEQRLKKFLAVCNCMNLISSQITSWTIRAKEKTSTLLPYDSLR